MKSFIKHIAIAFSTVLCGISCQSCVNDDSEELFMTEIGAYSSLGTVVENNNLVVESDSYGLLHPVNKEIFTDNQASSIGQRVLMEINFMEANPLTANENIQDVRVERLYKVLTKSADDIRTSGGGTTNADQIYGNQPIAVTAASISKSHLNIQFNIGGNNTNIAHRISLLLTEESVLDEEGLLRVELRHNPENDLQKEPFWGVVSFTLSSIPEYEDPKFKGFRIVYNSGRGAEEYVVKTSDTNTYTRSIGYLWHSRCK